MRAVIPVAGIGTRMRPHTYSLPKVLLNVAGKPILGHILDELKKYDVTEVTIIRGYKGDQVEEYVSKDYSEMNFDFVEQKEMLGLGHAIYQAEKTFNDEPILIILGDTIFDVDLNTGITPGQSMLGVRYVEDPRRFGVVLKDDNGNVNKLVEKPDTPISNLAIVGIYYIDNSKLLADSLKKLIDEDIKTRGEYQLTDALQLMMDNGEKFGTFEVGGWFDCGKPETLLATNKYLLEKNHRHVQIQNSIIIPPVYISKQTKIENCVIGPYATISRHSEISNSIINNSIVSFGSKVKNSLLTESIIGADAKVEGHFSSLNVGDSSEIINKIS
jgi:glucose-1-phosphate thymidylyltransferase